MGKPKRQFSAEFKREAVQAVLKPGSSIAQVARQLEVSDSLLGMWVKKFKSGGWEATPGKELKTTAATELERVQRELNRVKMERDILKKALVSSTDQGNVLCKSALEANDGSNGSPWTVRGGEEGTLAPLEGWSDAFRNWDCARQTRRVSSRRAAAPRWNRPSFPI